MESFSLRTEKKKKQNSGLGSEKGWLRAKSHSHLLLLSVKVIILCSNDLRPNAGRRTSNTRLRILGRVRSARREG